MANVTLRFVYGMALQNLIAMNGCAFTTVLYGGWKCLCMCLCACVCGSGDVRVDDDDDDGRNHPLLSNADGRVRVCVCALITIIIIIMMMNNSYMHRSFHEQILGIPMKYYEQV